MLRKIFIKVLFCLPLLLTYMILSVNGDVFTLDPVNIIARLMSHWSDNVINGIEAGPVAFEYSKLFLYGVIMFVFIKFIRPGIRDRKIVARVKGNFDIVLYVYSWILIIAYGFVLGFTVGILGFEKLMFMFYFFAVILKIYTDFQEKMKAGD